MKKKKQIKDIPSSVRAKLLNIARETGQTFEFLLLRYFQERLLYRIYTSKYKDKFVLKGGLLFLAYKMPAQRITRDIDLLGLSQEENPDDLKHIFIDIISVNLSDGVNFITETLTVESIILENIHKGKRINFTAELAKAKLLLQIDIGYGDIVFPEPYKLEFPSLLDFPATEVIVYPKESVIAEKFHEIVKRKLLNSRMKDFYDILHFAGNQIFDIKLLNKSLKKTFERRNTPVSDAEFIFNDNFRQDINMQNRWQGFIRRNKLSITGDFSEVFKKLELFLKPVCIIEKRASKNMFWDKEKWEWI